MLWEFLPSAQLPEHLLLRSRASGVPVLVYLLLLLKFASSPYHFICFLASNCLQMSLSTILLEGILSYNPPVRKSAFRSFDHFLIQPPPFVATLHSGALLSNL